MYIHRVVIDANCINSKGRMPSMNELEDYHHAGLIEILKTSTLDAEFRTAPLQKEKAKNYIMIGGSAVRGEEGYDARYGAVSGKSKFYEYYLEIFGPKLGERFCRRSIRDCLHIDQAILNHANYFVTNEKMLIQAGLEIQSLREKIKIVSPENCLSELKSYFKTNYGTSDLCALKSKEKDDGSVIMGSNSSYGFRIIDPTINEVLLSSYIDKGKLIVETRIRNKSGELVLEISEGNKMVFHSFDTKVKGIGKGPLTIGEESFIQIYIASDEVVYLSARYLSSGKILFDCVNLYSRDSKRKFSVNRELMELKGLNLVAPKKAL